MKFKLLILLFSPLLTCGQKDSLKIRLFFDQQILQLNKKYTISHASSEIEFNIIKFYISDIYNNNFLDDELHYELFDLQNSNSHTIAIHQSSDAEKRPYFFLGIDSSICYEGVRGEALDPIHGMYWAWQSGYINIKIEGKLINKTAEIPFQYHIGGFISPYQAFKKVYLDALNKKINCIAVDFSTIFDQSILSRPKTIMRPCKEAIDFLDRFIESIKTICDE